MDFQRHALILAMVDALRQQGSRTGKSHIIKGLFLVQAAGLVELPFRFFLYKHGPYSTDIETCIEHMKTYGAVEVEPAFDGYGVFLNPGVMASFAKKRSSVPEQTLHAIHQVCQFIRNRNAKDLERLATAAWIRTVEKVEDPDEVARRLHQLKPHVSLPEAILADEEVRGFLQESSQL